MSIVKRFILFILIFILLAVSAFWLVLHRADLLVDTVKSFIKEKAPQIQLTSLKIGKAGFVPHWQYQLNDVDAEWTMQGSSGIYIFHADKIYIDNLPRAIKSREHFLMTATGVRFQDLEHHVDSIGFTCQAKATIREPASFLGGCEGSLLKIQEYKFTNILSHFNHKEQAFEVEDFQAQAYSGNVNAKFLLEYADEVTYHMEVSLKELDALRLKEAQPFLENIRGKISGTIEADGNFFGIKNISGTLRAVNGGEIKAILLQPILQYVPASQQKVQLEKVIKEGGLVPLETAIVDLSSTEEEKLSTHFDLKSKEYNLDLNLTVDFNVEGGVLEMLKMQKTFLKP